MKAKSTVDAPRSRRQSIDTSTPNMNGTSAIGAPRMKGKRTFGAPRMKEKSTDLPKEGKKQENLNLSQL